MGKHLIDLDAYNARRVTNARTVLANPKRRSEGELLHAREIIEAHDAGRLLPSPTRRWVKWNGTAFKSLVAAIGSEAATQKVLATRAELAALYEAAANDTP